MNRLMLTIMLMLAAMVVSLLSFHRQPRPGEVIVVNLRMGEVTLAQTAQTAQKTSDGQTPVGKGFSKASGKRTVVPKKAQIDQSAAGTAGASSTDSSSNNVVDLKQAKDWGGCYATDNCYVVVDENNNNVYHVTLPKDVNGKPKYELRAMSQITCADCAKTDTTVLPDLVDNKLPTAIQAQKDLAQEIVLDLIRKNSNLVAKKDDKKDDGGDDEDKLSRKQRDEQMKILTCKKDHVSEKSGKAVGDVDDYQACAQENLEKFAESTDPLHKKAMKQLEADFTNYMAGQIQSGNMDPDKWNDFMNFVNNHSSTDDNLGIRIAYRAQGKAMMPILGLGLASMPGVDPVTAANYVSQAHAEQMREGPRFYMGFAQQRSQLANLQRQYEATLPNPSETGYIPNVSDVDYQIAQGLNATPQTPQLYMLREQSQEKTVAAQLKQAGISLDGTQLGSQLGGTQTGIQQTAQQLTQQAFQWVVGSDDPRGETSYRGMSNGVPLKLNYNADLAGLDLCGPSSSVANTSICQHPFRTQLQNGTVNAGLYPNNTIGATPQNLGALPVGRGFGRGGTNM